MLKKRALLTTFLISVLILSFSLSGCETLRKKFSRSSKKQEEIEYEPVLDPIDYPESVYNPIGDYSYRFNMFHALKKELIFALSDESQPKRLSYMMDSMIVQLEEMEKFIPKEKKGDLPKQIEEFKKIQTKLEGPEQFQNRSLIKSKVNSMTQDIRSNYQPREVEKYIINPKL